MDIEEFTLANVEEKTSCRQNLGLPTGKIIILVPRRLYKKNGVKYSIFAAKNLKKEFEDFFEKGLEDLEKDLSKGKKKLKK